MQIRKKKKKCYYNFVACKTMLLTMQSIYNIIELFFLIHANVFPQTTHNKLHAMVESVYTSIYVDN